MLITRTAPSLPLAGDTVIYKGRTWEVLSYDIDNEDLCITDGATQVTIHRLDID